MNVLLTGGNAALQHSIAAACVAAGHSVRVVLTAPHAIANPWPAQVEPVDPDATPDTLRELARQCDTAVAVSPALSLSLGGSHEATIARTLEAAALAGIRRLILLTGLNDRSALRPNGFPIDCLVIRTAPPYGVTDDLITLFLIMMRSLPVVPLLPDSSVMQPIWHEDLARCVAASLALPSNRTATVMTVIGPDAITSRELYERLARQIDRHPLRVTIPDFFARQVGFTRSVDTDSDGGTAFAPFGELVRTPLDEGLQRMIRELAEVTPEEGVGGLQLKTFSTTIAVATSASAVMSLLRTRFGDMMPVPVGTEPAVPTQTLSAGSVLTIALPGRGHVQVRVVEAEATQTTLATLRGHTVAGIVRFSTDAVPGGVSFQVTTCDRAANAADWMALSLGAARLQDANWTTVVKNVAVAAGEPDADVRVDSKRLAGAEARQLEWEIADLLRRHHERVAGPATSSRM